MKKTIILTGLISLLLLIPLFNTSHGAFFGGDQGGTQNASTVVPPPNGSDDTAVIQAALDQKGHVVIKYPGTYLCGKLVIDSDTWLDIRGGVTIKKKDGTDDALMVNAAHVAGSGRNRNIKITGGLWDFNKANNSTTGDYPVGWPGYGMLFHWVDGLTMTDWTQTGPEFKHLILPADCTKLVFRNMHFDTDSAAIQCQPPIIDIIIENITGVTGDDSIAFTMGDWESIDITWLGNVENVVINNIDVESGASIVKLAGKGRDGNSIFKNINISNITGRAVNPVIFVYHDSLPATGDLEDATIENMNISRVTAFGKTSGGGVALTVPVIQIEALKANITIEDCKWDRTKTNTFINVVGNTGIIDSLVIKNVVCLDTGQAPATGAFVRTETMIIKNLLIQGCNMEFPDQGSSSTYFIWCTNGTMENISIDSCYFKSNLNIWATFDGTAAVAPSLRINNSYIEGSRLFIAHTLTNAFISNSTINLATSIMFFNDNADVVWRSVNCDYPGAATIINLPANPGTRDLRIDAQDRGYTGLLAVLTPAEGDFVRSSNVSETEDTGGKGVYYYNGTAWEKK